MSTTSLNETIALHYDHLTKSSRKIADYLLAHAEEAQYLSISSLARECGVAEATIFRFCRALGFGPENRPCADHRRDGPLLQLRGLRHRPAGR